MNVAGRNKALPKKALHFLFWLIITLVFLYDRKYLIQKYQLPDHFIECVVVRLLLIISLVYLHFHYLVPRFFQTKKYVIYTLLLLSVLLVYVGLQNLYDIYLYGYVIGDLKRRDFWQGFPYNFITTSWYLFLATTFKITLDWYEEKYRMPVFVRTDVVRENDQARFIFLKTGTRQVKTNIDAVSHIKGLKDYSIIFTTDEQIIVKGSLKVVEKLFEDKKFVRVHKSYLVALDLIKSINDNHIIIGEHNIPIGRSYKNELYNLLKIQG